MPAGVPLSATEWLATSESETIEAGTARALPRRACSGVNPWILLKAFLAAKTCRRHLLNSCSPSIFCSLSMRVNIGCLSVIHILPCRIKIESFTQSNHVCSKVLICSWTVLPLTAPTWNKVDSSKKCIKWKVSPLWPCQCAPSAPTTWLKSRSFWIELGRAATGAGLLSAQVELQSSLYDSTLWSSFFEKLANIWGSGCPKLLWSLLTPSLSSAAKSRNWGPDSAIGGGAQPNSFSGLLPRVNPGNSEIAFSPALGSDGCDGSLFCPKMVRDSLAGPACRICCAFVKSVHLSKPASTIVPSALFTYKVPLQGMSSFGIVLFGTRKRSVPRQVTISLIWIGWLSFWISSNNSPRSIDVGPTRGVTFPKSVKTFSQVTPTSVLWKAIGVDCLKAHRLLLAEENPSPFHDDWTAAFVLGLLQNQPEVLLQSKDLLLHSYYEESIWQQFLQIGLCICLHTLRCSVLSRWCWFVLQCVDVHVVLGRIAGECLGALFWKVFVAVCAFLGTWCLLAVEGVQAGTCRRVPSKCHILILPLRLDQEVLSLVAVLDESGRLSILGAGTLSCTARGVVFPGLCLPESWFPFPDCELNRVLSRVLSKVLSRVLRIMFAIGWCQGAVRMDL